MYREFLSRKMSGSKKILGFKKRFRFYTFFIINKKKNFFLTELRKRRLENDNFFRILISKIDIDLILLHKNLQKATRNVMEVQSLKEYKKLFLFENFNCSKNLVRKISTHLLLSFIHMIFEKRKITENFHSTYVPHNQLCRMKKSNYNLNFLFKLSRLRIFNPCVYIVTNNQFTGNVKHITIMKINSDHSKLKICVSSWFSFTRLNNVSTRLFLSLGYKSSVKLQHFSKVFYQNTFLKNIRKKKRAKFIRKLLLWNIINSNEDNDFRSFSTFLLFSICQRSSRSFFFNKKRRNETKIEKLTETILMSTGTFYLLFFTQTSLVSLLKNKKQNTRTIEFLSDFIINLGICETKSNFITLLPHIFEIPFEKITTKIKLNQMNTIMNLQTSRFTSFNKRTKNQCKNIEIIDKISENYCHHELTFMYKRTNTAMLHPSVLLKFVKIFSLVVNIKAQIDNKLDIFFLSSIFIDEKLMFLFTLKTFVLRAKRSIPDSFFDFNLIKGLFRFQMNEKFFLLVKYLFKIRKNRFIRIFFLVSSVNGKMNTSYFWKTWFFLEFLTGSKKTVKFLIICHKFILFLNKMLIFECSYV